MSSSQDSTAQPQQVTAHQTGTPPPSTVPQPPPLPQDGHPSTQPKQQAALPVDGNIPPTVQDQQQADMLQNATNALQAAAMAQHQAGLAFKGCENLAKAQARTDRWTCDLTIHQVKDEFKTPADKKVKILEI